MPLNDKQNFIIKLLAIVGLIAVILISILRDRIVNYPRREISVSGQGRVFVKPDVAQITLAVNVFKKLSAGEALKESSEKINRVISKLKELGVEDKDAQTTNFSLNPEYEFAAVTGKNKITGYSLKQELKIKIRNFNNIGKVIEKTIEEGVNQVGDIQFVIDDPEKARKEARLKAIENAEEKAREMADATGIKLGKAVGFWENISYPPIDFYSAKEGLGGDAPIRAQSTLPAGQNEVIVEINLSYEVK